MDILIIKDKSKLDLDIITKDGGYAFIWYVDDVYKGIAYQGKITEAIKDGQLPEDICLSNSYSSYFYEQDTEHKILNQVLEFLIPQEPIKDRNYINKVGVYSKKEINKFLKLK